MWKKTENSNAEKPLELDKNSSSTVVYIRRNFKLIPEAIDEHGERPAHWEYEENAIDIDRYELYEDMQDINAALVELADIVGGVE